MDTKRFPLRDVLTVTTGRLISTGGNMDGLYNILNWMTDDNLFTHQLVRASEEAEPILFEDFPELKNIQVPEDLSDETKILAWLDSIKEEFGTTRVVRRIPKEQHQNIDPITELLDMRPDAKILAVEVVDDSE
jgi:hypothetical protein